MSGTKHLEMLHATIGRLAGHSFLAKGWSVTLASAIIGLAAKDGSKALLWVGGLTLLIFWSVDAYYLALERAFRTLFTAAAERARAGGEETFDMRAAIGFDDVRCAAFRPAALMVHLPLLAALVLAGLLIPRAAG